MREKTLRKKVLADIIACKNAAHRINYISRISAQRRDKLARKEEECANLKKQCSALTAENKEVELAYRAANAEFTDIIDKLVAENTTLAAQVEELKERLTDLADVAQCWIDDIVGAPTHDACIAEARKVLASTPAASLDRAKREIINEFVGKVIRRFDDVIKNTPADVIPERDSILAKAFVDEYELVVKAKAGCDTHLYRTCENCVDENSETGEFPCYDCIRIHKSGTLDHYRPKQLTER